MQPSATDPRGCHDNKNNASADAIYGKCRTKHECSNRTPITTCQTAYPIPLVAKPTTPYSKLCLLGQ